jgi:signal transduction histidine kinase
MPRILPNSLSSRLILVFVGYLLVSFVLIALTVCYFTSLSTEKRNAFTFDEQFRIVASGLQYGPSGRPEGFRLGGDKGWIYSVSPKDLQYRIIDGQDRVIFSSVPDAPALVPTGPSLGSALQHFDILQDASVQHVQTRKFPRANNSTAPEYTIQIGMSDRMLAAMQLRFTHPISQGAFIILVILTVLFLAMSAIAFVTVRRMLKPLQDVSAIAKQISTRHLQQRLPLDRTPQELQPLLEAFNEALGRLEKGFNEQQEFLATTAHELKTPLALLRGEIELADEMASRELLLGDIDRISRHVHQLLNLAEVRELRNFQFDYYDISIVIKDVARYLQRQADLAGVAIRLVNILPRLMRVDRSAIFVLLKNLTENAIQHSPRDSTIFICLGEQDLRVIDEGEGVPPENLTQLFTRFWRSPSRRSAGGAGLGLSICQEVASAHEWTLGVENQNIGTAFFVRFQTS